MKKKLISMFFMFTCLYTFANPDLLDSKSLIGFWRMHALKKQPDGKDMFIPLPSYKLINPDSTFVTFYTNRKGNGDYDTDITVMGKFTITSDSTFKEFIEVHANNEMMNGITSELKYRLLDSNTMISFYKNPTQNVWIPELWIRVNAPELDSKKKKK